MIVGVVTRVSRPYLIFTVSGREVPDIIYGVYKNVSDLTFDTIRKIKYTGLYLVLW